MVRSTANSRFLALRYAGASEWQLTVGLKIVVTTETRSHGEDGVRLKSCRDTSLAGSLPMTVAFRHRNSRFLASRSAGALE